MVGSPRRLAFFFAVLAVLGPSSLPWAAPKSDCTARLSARLDTKEDSHLQFKVEVSCSKRCAKIEYDLVIEEAMANGQTHMVRKVRVVKLNDGSLTEMVRHELEPGHRMLSYKAETVWCQTCQLGD